MKNTTMKAKLQNGIFYLGTPKMGSSCHIAFIRAGIGSNATEISDVLVKLWAMFNKLEKGIVNDLEGVNERHLHSGNLTVLVGYGYEIFDIKDLKKEKPVELKGGDVFKDPSLYGGGPIVQDSNIKYSKDVVKNDVGNDHVILQFTGDNEFITSRAVLETWKLLSTFQNSQGNVTLYIHRIFNGFQREDKRNWLGFHDGVSNLPSKDRLQVISITRNDVTECDSWTVNGTYMGFLRIEFDLGEWSKLSNMDQSKIIGRDKITGCPLIGVDKYKQPIKDNRCPVRGTFEVLEKGNEIFREHPAYGKQRLAAGVSDKLLERSHIATVNPTYEQSDRGNSYRIYRQGFEFFEQIEAYPGFRAGLNFISFQKSPKRLFNILRRGFGKNTSAYDNEELLPFENFFSVRTAEVFFVPPTYPNEPFPGAAMFLDEQSTYTVNKYKYSKDSRQQDYRLR
jgi:deferrochelatase/peroxidase EfeB